MKAELQLIRALASSAALPVLNRIAQSVENGDRASAAREALLANRSFDGAPQARVTLRQMGLLPM